MTITYIELKQEQEKESPALKGLLATPHPRRLPDTVSRLRSVVEQGGGTGETGSYLSSCLQLSFMPLVNKLHLSLRALFLSWLPRW